MALLSTLGDGGFKRRVFSAGRAEGLREKGENQKSEDLRSERGFRGKRDFVQKSEKGDFEKKRKSFVHKGSHFGEANEGSEPVGQPTGNLAKPSAKSV